MNHILTTCVAAAAVIAAPPALACMPMPSNAGYEIAGTRAAFVGRVTSIEPGDQTECLAAARSRSTESLEGDPGERGCEAFGFATLEPAWIIKGEDLVTGPFRVAWNQTEFCAVGWKAEVGTLAVAFIPQDASTLHDGITAVVEGGQQGDLLVQIILELVRKIQN